MINHTSSCVFITRLMSLSQAFQAWLALAVAIYCGGTLSIAGPLRGMAGKERKEVGRKTKDPCSWTLVSRPQGCVCTHIKIPTEKIQWIAKSQLNSVELLFPTKKFEIYLDMFWTGSQFGHCLHGPAKLSDIYPNIYYELHNLQMKKSLENNFFFIRHFLNKPT